MRGVKHHVCEGGGPSGLSDVVPLDEETMDCGGWSTTSVRAAGHPDLGSWCFLRPGTLVFRNERSRCTKCTAASSIYYAFFGAASSKAKPAPPGNAPLRSAAPRQVRRSPRRPAAPRRPGNALQVRRSPRCPAAPRRPGNALQVRRSPRCPAAPSPHRRSLLIGEACASRAYIGRLGMRTVKVVPSPGMLST